MSRETECGTKIQYRTRSQAEDGMWGYKRHTMATRMSVYRCKYCNFYHFGHVNVRARRR